MNLNLRNSTSFINVKSFFQALPVLPFATIMPASVDAEGAHALNLPHYMLRLTSLKTAKRHLMPLRFTDVVWDSRNHDEKVVVSLLGAWIKSFLTLLNEQNEDERFELMPAHTRWTTGNEEKKADVKEDDFIAEEAKKMFQSLAAYTLKPGPYAAHLGPRLSVHVGKLGTDQSAFSIDGSWNVSSNFSIHALVNKTHEEFRKEVSAPGNTYHHQYLYATTSIAGRPCVFQLRDDILGELLPEMVNRQSVENEVNKAISAWARGSFGFDLHQHAVKLDFIERDAE
jgi:hypothetical protein